MRQIGLQIAGAVVPAALFAAGVGFFILCGRYMVAHPKKTLYGMLGASAGQGTSPGAAFSVALAGTLGVGNITGVAAAIAAGGPGAVFWMWIAALVAMPVKYAEITLALSGAVGKERRHGGAMYYVKTAFRGRAGSVLSVAFCLFCLLAMVTLGGMVQSHAAAEAVSGVFGLPPLAAGAFLALGAGFVLWRGADRVEAFCARLMPLLCALFVGAAAAVICLHAAGLPSVLASIFRGAFSVRAAAGGVGASAFFAALRAGFMRGLVSNEAGCGTAPIAHAAAHVRSPAQQGFWGVFEVFVDTVLLCTLTAFCILLSGSSAPGDGTMAALCAFLPLGAAAGPLFSLLVLFFAFATLLCWAHYGGECLFYLTKKEKADRLVVPAVALSSVFGALLAPRLLWSLTDAAVAGMTLVNLAALRRCRRTVVAETTSFFTAGDTAKAGADRSRRRFFRRRAGSFHR